jgi:outer membrane receptor protein involved in Fe transport
MRAGRAPAFFLLIFFPCLLALAQNPPAQQDPNKTPDPVKTSVTVTEKISTETPANVSVLDRTGIEQSPGTNLDDRLRDVPGFSLFRRSSSLVANPTTQGISLRGIGSSGASRTLVLWDGIPANDPFGGWVYWTQFVPDEMNRVEISRGAATSVFGEKAMTGAIGVFSRAPERLHVLGQYEYGNQNTHDVTGGFSDAWPQFAFSGAVRAFTSDGYFIVPENIRGAADTKAGVRFVTADTHLDHYGSIGDFFFKVNMLAEERKNGTQFTHNSTGMGTVSLRYVKEMSHDSFSVMGFHTREGFHSSFDTVTNNRNTDRLSYTQTVPNDALGGAAMWQHHEATWNLLGGADVDRIGGTSTDHLIPTGQRIGGGVQLQHGLFTQADVTLGSAKLFAGVRHTFAGQDSRFLSPSGGFVVGRKRLRARGSIYRSFRAPTLNELYREFRAGSTDTLANPLLKPETLWGAEAGFDVVGESSTLRVTAYRNSLDGLITNVTLSSSPTAIVRQRANAAAAISRGFEAEFRERWHNWSGNLQYLYAESRYVTGFRVAQVPKHQGIAQVLYHRDGTLASFAVRAYSYQFDDDLNQFRLPGFATAQMVLRQRMVKSLSAELTLENALDRVFYTAFTPTPNIGAPRLVKVGLLWDGKLR